MTDKRKVKKLNSQDFEKVFGTKLSDKVKKRIEKAKIEYFDVKKEERDYCIRRAVDILLDANIVKAGEHREKQWEDGWGENLTEYKDKSRVKNILPKYFGKYPYLRWKQDFIKGATKDTEYKMLGVLLDWLFSEYVGDFSNIYEFGCGTGHNLLRVRDFNKKAKLWGLDWASSSQKLLNKMRREEVDKKLFAHNFDYFHPDWDFKIEKNSIIFTVASLEQIGDKFKPFVKYVLKKKPKFCLHIEPIGEVLDENHLLDYLSKRYFEKRNYLNGYLDYLKELEKKGKIKIVRQQRSYIGSMFVDGYSIIAWKVL